MKLLKNIEETKIKFSQTIPKALVHKKHIENVFVSHITEVKDNEFECGCILPLANVFFCQFDEAIHKNILMIVEICRQASMAILHIHSNVPKGTNFVLNMAEVQLLSKEKNDSEFDENEITIKVKRKALAFTPAGQPKAFQFFYDIYANGKKYATGIGGLSLHTKERYQKLRSLSRQKIIGTRNFNLKQSERTDRLHFSSYTNLITNLNFSINESIGNCDLVVDTRHLFFFDHFNDHVPGMLLLASFRQLVAEYVKKCYPDSGHFQFLYSKTQFIYFGELDHNIHIKCLEIKTCKMSKQKDFVIKAYQNKKVLAEAKMSVYLN